MERSRWQVGDTLGLFESARRVAGILVAIAQRLVNGKSREDGNGDDGGIRAGVDRGPG